MIKRKEINIGRGPGVLRPVSALARPNRQTSHAPFNPTFHYTRAVAPLNCGDWVRQGADCINLKPVSNVEGSARRPFEKAGRRPGSPLQLRQPSSPPMPDRHTQGRRRATVLREAIFQSGTRFACFSYRK